MASFIFREFFEFGVLEFSSFRVFEENFRQNLDFVPGKYNLAEGGTVSKMVTDFIYTVTVEHHSKMLLLIKFHGITCKWHHYVKNRIPINGM